MKTSTMVEAENLLKGSKKDGMKATYKTMKKWCDGISVALLTFLIIGMVMDNWKLSIVMLLFMMGLGQISLVAGLKSE